MRALRFKAVLVGVLDGIALHRPGRIEPDILHSVAFASAQWHNASFPITMVVVFHRA